MDADEVDDGFEGTTKPPHGKLKTIWAALLSHDNLCAGSVRAGKWLFNICRSLLCHMSLLLSIEIM
jgi:hypothetical protein